VTLARRSRHESVTPSPRATRSSEASPTSEGSREVLLLTVDAGGGHRAAANALMAARDEKDPGFRFRVANLQEVFAPLDVVKRTTGLSLEEGYNLVLRRRWTALLGPLLRLLHLAIAIRRRSLVAAFARHLAARTPAAVLSVVPNFNGVVRDAVRRACPGVPVIVLLTDFADFPPRFWIEPGLDRVIVATDRARAQARAIGLTEDRISTVSGMVLNPHFYAAGEPTTRARVREELGLDAAFTVLLLFGGKGSPEMEPLARSLLERSTAWQLVALCGQNPDLLARLGELSAKAGGRLRPFGFTTRVADYMAAADLLVTKPGPGSLAEAFQARLPVVVTRNRHTILQERFNTDFVAERGLGVVVGDWREIPGAVARLTEDARDLGRLRANIETLPENRAVYEVIEIVDAAVGRG
jgi:UDP-N-acetylglucosamine:LPS N-acetylglucosamine transferase